MREQVHFSLDELLAATRGDRVAGRSTVAIDGVCTDTRMLAPGDLFVAVKGENFDGHDFVSQALARGAGALLVATHALAKLPTMELGERGVPILAVDDTRQGLGLLARAHRRRFPGVQVVSITGSNGKTSTKELTAAGLSTVGPTCKTLGNLNNDIGLPFVLFGLRPEHRFAVIELGMNAPGEITWLASLAQPRVGLVTNVAAAHTEGLGSIEGVAKAKGELYEAIRPDGVAVVNLDDARVVAQAARTSANQVGFGAAPAADVRVLRAESAGGRSGGAWGLLQVQGQPLEVQLRLLGRHNVTNAAAAVAVGLACGLDPAQVVAALSSVAPSPHRMVARRLPSGVTLLDDCYNANPGSMAAALAALTELAAAQPAPAGRPAAVIGEMRELGGESAELHRQVGRQAAAAGVQLLLTVGAGAEAAGEAASQAGLSAWQHFADTRGVAEALQRWVRPGDRVLIKGSRRVGLERVVDELGPVVGEGD